MQRPTAQASGARMITEQRGIPSGAISATQRITLIAVTPEGLLFAGTEHGAWRSTDRGASWTGINEGNGDTVKCLAVSGTGRIFIATETGLFMSTTDPDAIPQTTAAPQTPSSEMRDDGLLRVIRTPAGVELRYELPQSGRVEMGLFDIFGRQIRSMMDEAQESGAHSLMLDTGSLPSGVYYVRLRRGNRVITQKIVAAR